MMSAQPIFAPRSGSAKPIVAPRSGWGGVILLLAFALALLAPAGPAQANGTPIRITLRYIDGLSNTGPRNATGVAELITSEGEVRLTAAGLQKPADNEEYQVWISSDQTGERMRLGVVAVNDGGIGRLDTVLRDPIPEKPWDLMVLSIEAKGSQPAAPGNKLSIAGRFSMTPGGGEAPRVLPNTGGEVPGAGTPPSGLLGLSSGGTILLALLVVGAIGFALGRVGSRRGA
jgi:hypothetical protein